MDENIDNVVHVKGVQPNAPTGVRRKSMRLKGYNYSCQGAYFVTICTHNKSHLLGKVQDSVMHLNAIGRFVEEEWGSTAVIRQEIESGEYVIMPNHFHAIVFINNIKGVQPNAPTGLKPRSLGALISGFKAAVTMKMRLSGYEDIVWQRNYYEHIIRNEQDYNAIAEYIIHNPENWAKDSLNQTS